MHNATFKGFVKGAIIGVILSFACWGILDFVELFLSEEFLSSDLWQNDLLQWGLFAVLIFILWKIMFKTIGNVVLKVHEEDKFNEGIAAWNIQDYPTALQKFRPFAEEGDPEAQFYVGFTYFQGLGVTQDNFEAEKWLKKSALQGETNAYSALGFIYGQNGEPTLQNVDEAIKWYSLAVDLGDEDAQHNLAGIYVSGWNVPKDVAKAIELHTTLAERGNSDSQICLGIIYHYEDSDFEDPEKALEWYKKAASQGRTEVHYAIGTIYSEGEVPRDIGEAIKWFTLALDEEDENSPDASFMMGLLYFCEDFQCHDFSKARKYFEIGTEKYKHPLAQLYLGLMYFEGCDLPVNYDEAYKWFNLSAEQDVEMAQYCLGLIYQNGFGVEMDYEQAIKWYSLAAEQSNPDAQNNLGSMYANGEGLQVDETQARRLFQSAAEQGDENAKINLELLNQGSVPKEYTRALQLQTSKIVKGNKENAQNENLLKNNILKFPTSFDE